MFKLRIGYLCAGITTGFILLVSFLTTLPDGKLHIVFCNVGQGDSAYIRFPGGRDMLIDAGPNEKVLTCLGKHMPFWDRTIDIAALTHPQKDHMEGLIPVLSRYAIGYVVKSDIDSDTEGYQKLLDQISAKKIPIKKVMTGQTITAGASVIRILWPTEHQLAIMRPSPPAFGGPGASGSVNGPSSRVLGASSANLNDGSLVIHIRYGTFDVLFTGDADSHVDSMIVKQRLADDAIEVLKVPHHGSKTGMTQGFLDWVYPSVAPDQRNQCNFNNVTIRQFDNCHLAVISVGKNSYGHPAKEIMEKLALKGVRVLRTDEEGDIEIISDGTSWEIK